MADDPLNQMRQRIEQCRRLADMILDPKAKAILRQMAGEVEADLAKLLAERAERNDMPRPE